MLRSVRTAAGTGRVMLEKPASRTRPSSAAVVCACWRGMRSGGPDSRDCFAESWPAGEDLRGRVAEGRGGEKRQAKQQAAQNARPTRRGAEKIMRSALKGRCMKKDLRTRQQYPRTA